MATWAADDGSLSADPSTTEDAQVIDTIGPYLRNSSTAITSKILSLYPTSDFEWQANASPYKASAQYFRASRIVRDIDPVCPLLATTRQVYQHGTKTVYLAELNATRLTPYWDAWSAPYGVSHLSDIPYFFNEAIVPPGDNSPAAFALSASYSGSFAAFANTGDPTGKEVKTRKETFLDWPVAYRSDSDEMAVLVIGGPYGTGSATMGAKSDSQQGKGAVFEQGSQVVMGIPHGANPTALKPTDDLGAARAAALEHEKLVERCAYINSLTG